MSRLAAIRTFLFAILSLLLSQEGWARQGGAYVDSLGVMRWIGSQKEVCLFGVNYTTPFAYAYRAHKRLGLSMKEAIDLDVEQMARLGLDAFRVHVWDREVSDVKGNLLSNEHLDLFDYLLDKLSNHGIKAILTPIRWGGNGWPEPDEVTPGFGEKYSRVEMITNPKAREAECTYLAQFINHENRYSHLSYRNDPNIIAVEVINEPAHPDNGQQVTDYINDMIEVLRKAGFEKPIFYNISQNWSDVQANAVTASKADGISFQWYPTDLVHGRMLGGNYLMNASNYLIPSTGVAGYDTKAKMVYEFEAADVGGSYMYPAMVRSFREAGMQFATMFAYDPTQIAWSNTEYPTHYLNLLYTPSKAISLMIAGAAFRQIPRMKTFGRFPDNNHFGDFSVSYESDLSQLNSDTEFVYSNSTSAQPNDPPSLRHVAGCGSSVVVRYDGTGAYFLDKLDNGIWRLEVYPDVLWLDDPFKAASMARQTARLFWKEREIEFKLPDLGQTYVIYPLSKAAKNSKGSADRRERVLPGAYLVVSSAASRLEAKKRLSNKEAFLPHLYTPPAQAPGVYVVNKSPRNSVSGAPAEFKLEIAGESEIADASLFVRRLGWRRFIQLPLKYVGGFAYVTEDSGKAVHSGFLEYCVSVRRGDKTYTYPGIVAGSPSDWDFTSEHFWRMSITEPGDQIALLDVARDKKDLVFPHFTRTMSYLVDYVNGQSDEEEAMSTAVSFINGNDVPFGVQLATAGSVKPFLDQINTYQTLVVKGRSGTDSTVSIGVNLLLADGTCVGTDMALQPTWKNIEIPLADFSHRDALILPNSYPLFLPKVWKERQNAQVGTLDLRLLQTVQIVARPVGVSKGVAEQSCRFDLVAVSLKK